MADTNDNNEGYEFPELDGYSPEGFEETISESESTSPSTNSSGFSAAKITPVWRNAIIVVAVIIVLMLSYKYFGNFFSSSKKTSPQISSRPKQPEQLATKPVPQVIQQPQPRLEPRPQLNERATDQVNQKLAQLEMSQKNINSNVNDVENKLNGLDGNVTDLSDKLSDINQQLAVIVDKLDNQANTINVLRVRLKAKRHPKPKIILPPPIRYYIQAVIPGRAWLIGSNGSTITVSKGSRLASYGKVRLIDAQGGLVLTSSGKVIRFDLQDF